METIITWLNTNQGAMLSLLTFAYVVCTAVIVVKMASANSLTQHSLRQAVELERQRSRPYVVFDVEYRANQIVYAVLKNTGLTAAYHVKVHCHAALINEFSRAPSSLVSTEIEFLAPQRTLEDIVANVGHFPSESEKPGPETIKGHVAYEDAQGARYSEPFSLNLAQHRKRVIFQPRGQFQCNYTPREVSTFTSSVNSLTSSVDAIARMIRRR